MFRPEVVVIDRSHDVSAFDCGVAALNDYLKKHAFANNANRSARTYLAIWDGKVAGYFTLAAGSVSRSEATSRIVKGLGNYPVPVILLARLAVDLGSRGQGLGKGLLKESLLRCVRAADIVGCRAILVHAKDDAARDFYRKFGFEPSPVDDRHLFLLMKDLLVSIGTPDRTPDAS